MQKTLIKQVHTIDVTVVEGAKQITGVAVVDHFQIADGEDVFNREVKRAATQDELAEICGAQLATATAANTTLNGQNTTLQQRVQTLEQLLTAAHTALGQIANSDAAALIAAIEQEL